MRNMILIGALCALAGCASSDTPTSSERVAELLKDARVGEQVDKICFQSTIDGFRENTRDSVILTRGVSDDYLVLMKGCRDLDRAQSLGLAGRGSCLRRSDRLIVSDSAFSLSGNSPVVPDQCWVDAIYRWDDRVDMTEIIMDEP